MNDDLFVVIDWYFDTQKSQLVRYLIGIFTSREETRKAIEEADLYSVEWTGRGRFTFQRPDHPDIVHTGHIYKYKPHVLSLDSVCYADIMPDCSNNDPVVTNYAPPIWSDRLNDPGFQL